MKIALRITSGVLLISVLVLAGGCGDGKEEQGGDEAFRVPDSLLSSVDAFSLTIDEYHPVKGGIMGNAQIELHYQSSQIARAVAIKAFGETLEGFRHVTEDIGQPSQGSIVVIGADDLDEYSVVTRKQWWYYAWVKGDTIYSSPIDIMLKRFDPVTRRSFMKIGMTQRLGQIALDRISAGKIPVWLKEAAASYVADERPILRVQIEEFRDKMISFSPTLEELEIYIAEGNDRLVSRCSYFFAYRMLEKLLEKVEFEDVVGFARLLGEGVSLDEASKKKFGMGYLEMVAAVRPANLFEGAGPMPYWRKQEEHGHDHEH